MEYRLQQQLHPLLKALPRLLQAALIADLLAITVVVEFLWAADNQSAGYAPYATIEYLPIADVTIAQFKNRPLAITGLKVALLSALGLIPFIAPFNDVFVPSTPSTTVIPPNVLPNAH